ncbi:small integral membrane protein 8 [Procambarus clarkii]|uniref:small integral membrane protein 8 n=1 Tax=Procambarus clarkii TaxID=6728 RepID=UPI001E6744AE|nr:small integral membrane protein 8-like [Procambarus clarkii]XP_045583503.1 small integral membrane protein 8-like [Procambarus clarkii]XP_045583506.1 small integral membrane protein 8-like [Procambarus clarkii]XP_045583511.1 small integral membrane protein 8-like [Procambarus clarkii]
MGNTTSMQKGLNSTPTSSSSPASGDGIKSIPTTGVFKAVNFELYVKPNLAVMTFGVVAILCSTAYLAYMKSQQHESKTYIAVAEDGTKHVFHKKSRWE